MWRSPWLWSLLVCLHYDRFSRHSSSSSAFKTLTILAAPRNAIRASLDHPRSSLSGKRPRQRELLSSQCWKKVVMVGAPKMRFLCIIYRYARNTLSTMSTWMTKILQEWVNTRAGCGILVGANLKYSCRALLRFIIKFWTLFSPSRLLLIFHVVVISWNYIWTRCHFQCHGHNSLPSRCIVGGQQ